MMTMKLKVSGSMGYMMKNCPDCAWFCPCGAGSDKGNFVAITLCSQSFKINLTDNTTEEFIIPKEWERDFLGGASLAARILYPY